MIAALPSREEARRSAPARRVSLSLARGLALGLTPREALEETRAACATARGRRGDTRLIDRLLRGLEAGEPLVEVVSAAGAPASFVAAIRAGQAAADLPGAVRLWAEMERREAGRTARLLDALGLYVPVIAVLYGGLVIQVGRQSDRWFELGIAARDPTPLRVIHLAMTSAVVWLLAVGGLTALLWRRPGTFAAVRLPGAARIAGRALAARLAERLAMLTEAGVSLGAALRLAGGERLDRVARRVEDGVAFSPALADAPWLSRWLGAPVRAAEASGDLPATLREAAAELRDDASAAVERLRGCIIVVGVLTAAVLVGAVAVSFFALLARAPGASMWGGG